MSIHEQDHVFMLERAGIKVSIDKSSLTVKVEAGDATWETVPGAASLSWGLTPTDRIGIPLSSATKKAFSTIVSGTFKGVHVKVGPFSANGIEYGVYLNLSLLLNSHNGELVFEVHEPDGEIESISEIVWPGGFRFFGGGEADYTAVPAMQGYLIPGNWREPVRRYHQGMMYGRDAYMPWWGQYQDGHGYLAIIDTPNDSRLSVEHLPSVHTHLEAVWLHSLGRFEGIRRLRVRFKKGLDYVAMAKMYRSYVHSLGKLRTLAQKQALNPKLEGLSGAAVVHTGVHTRIAPESYYYDKTDPEKNDFAVPFEERAAQLKELGRRYGDKLYVHVDGWGLNGYDNLHPDVLPPSPTGGGYEGMRKLQETCNEEGILFAIHDNYRDFYHDAASYHPDLTIKDGEGKEEFSDYWAGGAHSWLCTSLSKGYVERNYDTLKANGIEPDGVYIDVFAVIPGDECYDPSHRMSRTECLAYRASCFEEIRSRGMLISSEEPADWAVPHLDLVHHAPYALDPGPGGGPAICVPAPLFSLVYHDAIVVPWSLERGAWGIPERDLGWLHGLLNGGVPYLSIQPTDGELEIVRTVARLHGLVGFAEMTGHEYVDGNWRRQRSMFADGTVVEIDLDEDGYRIMMADGEVWTNR
ncbi:DUF5696 domain-containing protein [Cohnella herbarum]|uniref:DUF6259 domain-containing protein n=1 Tax=Cohnella herbarum TaxID=2728023 RepID=A0A7Z2ZQJ5_9BACL|nr:DUF5696 domain-containing protein [Cohnella herbarum]QJD87097.1 hypothetical protein HH215_30600 [Cohnella herbarum]